MTGVKRRSAEIKANLDLTAMIDVVFQLLIFFVMTFRIVEQEGDFRMKMPATGPRMIQHATPLPTIVLAVRANASGGVADIRLNSEPMADLVAVTDRLTSLLADQTLGSDRSTFEMELACSPSLNYREVIRALDAVTGIRHRDGSITPLLERVRLEVR